MHLTERESRHICTGHSQNAGHWPLRDKKVMTNINISQGSVATHLRCGGIFNDDFYFTNFHQFKTSQANSHTVKEVWKSVSIWLKANMQYLYIWPIFMARKYGCWKMHPYIRPICTGAFFDTRTYGPYIWVSKNAPIDMGHKDGPYLWAVCTGTYQL